MTGAAPRMHLSAAMHVPNALPAPSRAMPIFIISVLVAAMLAGLLAIDAGNRGAAQLSDAHAVVDLLPGVTVEEAPPPRVGLIVTSLQSGGAAMAAGLRVDDAIVAIDHARIATTGDAVARLRHQSGGTVSMDVARGNQLIVVTLRRSSGDPHGA